MAVLQVGGGVAGEGEHFVPGKGVVALAVGEEVGVFDGAEADDAGDLAALGFGEGGVFLGDDGEGALLGFVEEVGEADGFAAAGFEGLAIGAEDGAEPDVVEAGGGGGLPAAEDGEELAEVVLLAAVGDVEDGVGRVGALAVVEGGEVGGGVVGGAVGFLHEGGEGDPLAVARDEKGVVFFRQGGVGEDAEGAFALAGDADGAELLGGVLEPGVVETFAEGDVEGDAEARVDGVELGLGEALHLAPDAEVFLVAGLELHEFLVDGVEGGGVFFRAGGDEFVEALHFTERIGGEGGGVALGFPRVEEHAELGAPVADVVVAHDAMPEEGGAAGEGVAEDGGADVADVHRLGDVGRAEVDEDGLRLLRGGDAEARVGGEGGELAFEGAGEEAEIDEAGPGDFGRGAEVGHVEVLDDLGGELARVGALLLGEDHGGIGLVVAKAGVGGGLDAGIGKAEVGEGGAEAGFELGGEGHVGGKRKEGDW